MLFSLAQNCHGHLPCHCQALSLLLLFLLEGAWKCWGHHFLEEVISTLHSKFLKDFDWEQFSVSTLTI